MPNTHRAGVMTKFMLRRHALCTGLYGYEAAPYYPGPLAVEHAGIYDAVGHEDVQIPENTPFYLPVGVWVCTQNYLGDGWGLTLAFRPLYREHELIFMHMNRVNINLLIGRKYNGGTHLGASGGIPGVAPGLDASHSGGAHLHIAYSEDVKIHTLRHYGKRAFTNGPPKWDYGIQSPNGGAFTGGLTFKRGHTNPAWHHGQS